VSAMSPQIFSFNAHGRVLGGLAPPSFVTEDNIFDMQLTRNDGIDRSRNATIVYT